MFTFLFVSACNLVVYVSALLYQSVHKPDYFLKKILEKTTSTMPSNLRRKFVDSFLLIMSVASFIITQVSTKEGGSFGTGCYIVGTWHDLCMMSILCQECAVINI